MSSMQSLKVVCRVRQLASESLHNEAGCQAFEVWTSGDRPNKLHLHEVYDDAGAVDLRLKSAHCQSFDADTADMITDMKVNLWDHKL